MHDLMLLAGGVSLGFLFGYSLSYRRTVAKTELDLSTIAEQLRQAGDWPASSSPPKSGVRP